MRKKVILLNLLITLLILPMTVLAVRSRTVELNSANNLFTLTRFGAGTSTPGTVLAIQGAANAGSGIFEGVLKAGSLTATSGLSVLSGTVSLPAGEINNTELEFSSLTYTAGSGLTGGGTVSLGGSATIDVGAGTGITVNANDVALTVPVAISSGGTNNTSAYTSGSVIFSNGTSLTQNNSNLFWDNSNLRLGVASATPGTALSVQDEANVGWLTVQGAFRSSSLVATSSAVSQGVGTTSPGTLWAIQGAANIGNGIFEGTLKAGTLKATSTLIIPFSSDPSLSETGSLALNTTAASTSLRYYDGSAERAIFSEIHSSAVYFPGALEADGEYSTTATTTYLLANYARPVTLLTLYCKVTATTTHSAYVEIGSGTASSTVNCDTSGELSTDTVSFNMRQDILISIGQRSGTPDWFTVTEQYRIDAD